MSGAQAAPEAAMREARRVANATVLERLVRGHPFLIDVRPAIEGVPGMRPGPILHAGPPMQAAVQGALVHSGMCRTLDDAARLGRDGNITFGPAHDHGMVGPMAGGVSSAMPVFVVRNETHG